MGTCFLFSFTQCLDSTWTVTKKSRAIPLVMSTSRGVIVIVESGQNIGCFMNHECRVRNLKKFMDIRNGSTIGFLSTWVVLNQEVTP